MDIKNSDRPASTNELLDVSVIAKTLHELTSSERYTVDSFMFLLQLKFQKEGKTVPMIFQQTGKLVCDVINVMDLELI